MTSAANTDAEQAQLEHLISAVSRLARPAEAQTAYLQSLGPGDSADELALEFDDVRDAVLPSLSAEQQTMIRALDVQLDAMSGAENAELWSHQALVTSEAWTRVRALARETLVSFHSEPAIPA